MCRPTKVDWRHEDNDCESVKPRRDVVLLCLSLGKQTLFGTVEASHTEKKRESEYMGKKIDAKARTQERRTGEASSASQNRSRRPNRCVGDPGKQTLFGTAWH